MEKDCLSPKHRPGPYRRAFAATLEDLAATIEFLPPKKHTRRGPETDSRGRETTGQIFWFGPQSLVRSNAIRLTLDVPGDLEECEVLLKNKALGLRRWGNRVSRWLDIISQQLHPEGTTMVTDYLYGHLRSPTGSRELALRAAEDDLNLRSAHMGSSLTRTEIAFTLDHLAHLPVPVAFEMLRSAETSLTLNDPLRSLVEAGTATEAALCTRYDVTAAHLKAREDRWTLGRLVSELHAVPEGLPNHLSQSVIERKLTAPRNQAVHRGRADHRTAVDALDVARDLVSASYGFSDGDYRLMAQTVEGLQPHYSPFVPPGTGYDIETLKQQDRP